MTWRWLPALVFLAAFPMTDARAQFFSCSGTSSGTVCKITSATVVNAPSTNPSVTYAWDATNSAPKSQSIVGCTTNGFAFTVNDEIGTAGTYPITVTASGTDKIDTSTTPFALNSNFESITFQCDGSGNWLVE
jgi:hypothetical protein